MEVKSEKEVEPEKSRTFLRAAKDAIHWPFEKMADGLVSLDVHPIRVTASKIPVSLLSIAAHQAHPIAGVIGFAAAAILDVLDGKVARKTGKVTVEGAMLDSLLDKVVNAFMYFYLATQMDWREVPLDQAIVFLMALNGTIDLVSQRMRGDFLKQAADAIKVIWDPQQATPGKNPQEANMAGKVKTHLQSYGILAALASIPEFRPFVAAMFAASVPLAAMSIYGRFGKK